MGEEKIGEIAWHEGVMLHELAPQSVSLEEAFIESTEGHVEYRGDRAAGAATPDPPPSGETVGDTGRGARA